MDEITEIINETPINIKKLHSIFSEMNPVDIAGLFEDIDKEVIGQVFRVLPKTIAAEVFAYIEPDEQQLIVENLTDKEISEIINKLFMDDTVDFIEEMPANVVKRVLQNVGVEKRKLINQILRYPEDSAGSVMTTEYINLREDVTVAEAFNYIRKNGVNKETIYTSYVITPDRKLTGSLSAKTLMLVQPEERVGDIMEKNVIHAHTTDDQEIVAGLFKKYDLLSMPVVDNDDRLVGIVTVDDVLEIMEEESTDALSMTVFPRTEVQLCIVHMVRNSVKYVPFKDRKAVTGALKKIYLAPSAELAEAALDEFASAWDFKYPMISKSWRTRWNEVIPFLKFSPEIRKAIYTTNAIESPRFNWQVQHRHILQKPQMGFCKLNTSSVLN